MPGEFQIRLHAAQDAAIGAPHMHLFHELSPVELQGGCYPGGLERNEFKTTAVQEWSEPAGELLAHGAFAIEKDHPVNRVSNFSIHRNVLSKKGGLTPGDT